MKFCTVTIGNSDNKLTQQEWSAFCLEVRVAVESYATKVHFQGWSQPDARWQNMCTTFDIDERINLDMVRRRLARLASHYSQEAIAFTSMNVEDVEMIGAS